jgi:hypothetical protein
MDSLSHLGFSYIFLAPYVVVSFIKRFDWHLGYCCVLFLLHIMCVHVSEDTNWSAILRFNDIYIQLRLLVLESLMIFQLFWLSFTAGWEDRIGVYGCGGVEKTQQEQEVGQEAGQEVPCLFSIWSYH